MDENGVREIKKMEKKQRFINTVCFLYFIEKKSRDKKHFFSLYLFFLFQKIELGSINTTLLSFSLERFERILENDGKGP